MFAKFFIDRPILSNVIGIVLILIGVVSLIMLPISQYPDITPPTVEVKAIYPGSNSLVLADVVGAPIEQEVNGVEDMLYMSSKSANDGTYTLTVTFALGTDIDMATVLVQNRVNVAMPRLPDEVKRQGVTVKKKSTAILQVVTLTSPDGSYDDLFLSNFASLRVRDELARIPGVGEAMVFGAASYSMRVWLDAPRLKSLGLTTKDVVNAISEQNVQVAAGQIGAQPAPDTQNFQFTVQTQGRLSEVSEFEDIIIRTATGGPTGRTVRVRDVARVELGGQTYDLYAQKSGKPASLVIIYQLPGANALDVAGKVTATMQRLGKEFPPGVAWDIPYDTTRFVEAAIEQVYHTLFEAAVLVLAVILIFLQDWRATLVPATVVPITILGGFMAMMALGFSVNLVTLFGIILAIGIVVDDAIIVVEGAAHHMEHGDSARDATVKAMVQLFGPIIGITLVLSCVFLPASFMSGITGQLYRQFALVIASTALVSALLAATMTPAQCALFLKPIVPGRNAFYRGFNKVYDAVEHFFVVLLKTMVHHAWTTMLVFVGLISVTFWFFSSLPTGFLPDEDQGYALVAVQLPGAASQSRTREVTTKLDAILAETPGVANWITFGGMSILNNANTPNSATVFVMYKDWSERGDLTQDKLVADLRRKTAAIQEGMILVVTPPPIQGLGNAGGFEMMVQDRAATGAQALENAAYEMMGAGRGQSGLSGVATTYTARTPQLYVDVDRTKVKDHGVQLSDVFSTMQAYLGSSYVNDFNKFGKAYQVRVQADSRYRLEAGDIGQLEVRNADGHMVPLGAVTGVRDVVGPDVVTRYNLYPAASLLGAAAPGFSSGQALSLMEDMAKRTLPSTMGFEWTTMAYQEKATGNEAFAVFGLAVLLVFLVLAAQYESWSAPAAIILVVPLALLGTCIAVAARGMDNNVYTQIGIVLLIALASKNAILIVEFARELRMHKGMSIPEAAVEGARARLRPILMTSFAFILGVVPLLTASGAGSASQRALGTAVFGGMLASTFLAVMFVPVFFTVIQRLSERGTPPSPKAQPDNTH
ncbi:multidrug efflux RND transporter permease subunit [Nitratidesulfovibrio liaohensis]|uniref:Multidrug efflux RND transporter permease subunit n=1 Tax=Nitratidesulfovibrio liaohensis TaxID=2604158 RepID=A0ABY9R1E4_9BACT|nr:multidrug efflux RND transporter permease subunit [Nitratidesulfovibrio liaohensis]WMW65570.1 multidrug efflux RND transporter permease subunit [Nitratidesulfovibrio liaohensis]